MPPALRSDQARVWWGMDKIKIYSPNQVYAASFFGGPFAAVYVILQNFRAMGNEAGARYAGIGGAAFVIAVMLILPFLPERFPNYVLPIVYSFVARQIAISAQMTKPAIQQSERYEFQPTWNVFGISVGFVLAFLVAAIAWLFALDAAGIIRL